MTLEGPSQSKTIPLFKKRKPVAPTTLPTADSTKCTLLELFYRLLATTELRSYLQRWWMTWSKKLLTASAPIKWLSPAPSQKRVGSTCGLMTTVNTNCAASKVVRCGRRRTWQATESSFLNYPTTTEPKITFKLPIDKTTPAIIDIPKITPLHETKQKLTSMSLALATSATNNTYSIS